MKEAIGKEGGISLVNELGGIRIKCRKLTMESGGRPRAGVGKRDGAETCCAKLGKFETIAVLC